LKRLEEQVELFARLLNLRSRASARYEGLNVCGFSRELRATDFRCAARLK